MKLCWGAFVFRRCSRLAEASCLKAVVYHYAKERR